MKCKKYKEWLYLYRDNELSPAQQRKLELHLKECLICRAEKQSIKRTANLVHLVKKEDPVLADPESLTLSVLNRVASRPSLEPAPASSVWGGKIFLRPAMRIAMSVTIMLILSIFAVQTTVLLKRVANLERRLAEQTIDPQGLDITPAMLNGFGDEFALLKTGAYGTLIRQQHHLTTGRAVGYWRRIQREIPEMQAISLNDGLSKHEMLLLLKKREDILELLPNL